MQEFQNFSEGKFECGDEAECITRNYKVEEDLPVTLLDFTQYRNQISDLKIPLEILEEKVNSYSITSAQITQMSKEFDEAQSVKYSPLNPPLETLLIHNGIMGKFVKNTRSGENRFKIYVPDSLLPSLIAYVHLCNGHVAKQVMLRRLSAEYYSPNLEDCVNRIVTACVSCALINKVNKSIVSEPQQKGTYPFNKLYFDLLEDLPTSRGYKHVLVYVDPFSKVCGACPLRNKTAESVLSHITNILQLLGPGVREIITDNAKCFRNKRLYDLAGLLGIKIRWTVPRRSQSKGQVEVYVRKISTLLRKYIVTSKDVQWDTLLHYVVLCINSRKNAQTKMVPYFAFRGLEEPMRNVLNTVPKEIYSHLTTLSTRLDIEKTRSLLEGIWARVEKELEKIDEAARRRYNLRGKGPVVEVGNVVVRKLFDTRRNTRLREKFSADLWVVISTSEQASMIVRLADNVLMKIANSDLKVIMLSDQQDRDLLPPEVNKLLFGSEIQQEKLEELLRKVVAESNYELPPAQPFEEESSFDKIMDDLKDMDSAQSKRKKKEEDEEEEDEGESDEEEVEYEVIMTPPPQSLKSALKSSDEIKSEKKHVQISDEPSIQYFKPHDHAVQLIK